MEYCKGASTQKGKKVSRNIRIGEKTREVHEKEKRLGKYTKRRKESRNTRKGKNNREVHENEKRVKKYTKRRKN